MKSVKTPAKLPKIATADSAGADLYAAESVVIRPNQMVAVSTGYKYHVNNPGTVGLVKGRSGLAFKHGVVAYNGVLDSDFKDEVKVLLDNRSPYTYIVRAGDRIAQIVVLSQETADWFESEDTERTSGFGHTGK